jgi:hypothetical protein
VGMELKEIKKTIGEDKTIRKISKNAYLISLFSIIDSIDQEIRWTAHFLNTKEKKLISYRFYEKELEEEDFNETFNELKLDSVKVEAKKAIEKAKSNFNRTIVKILITLSRNKHTLWTISLISPDLTACKFEIDAKTNDIRSMEEMTLFKRL